MLNRNIYRPRTEKKLTQEELAEKIGVTQMAVSFYERGVRKPTVAVLMRLADVLECSADDLLGRNKRGGKNHDRNH